MSLIRCTSNPEGLYVWEPKVGRKLLTVICWAVQPPLSSGRRDEIIIPSRVFHKAVRRWVANGEEAKVEVEGFTIEEKYVFVKTGRVVPSGRSYNPLTDKRKAAFLIRLGYKGKFVYLWGVTWAYVVKNARTV